MNGEEEQVATLSSGESIQVYQAGSCIEDEFVRLTADLGDVLEGFSVHVVVVSHVVVGIGARGGRVSSK